MNDLTPGLRVPRRLRNVSKQPAKVDLAIPPGDELAVSDDVADQLLAARVGMQEADDRTDAIADAAAAAVASPDGQAPLDVSAMTKKELTALVAERGLEVDTTLKVAELRTAVADVLAAPTEPSAEA